MTDDAYPDRPHLTHSRPLQWTYVAATEATGDAIDHLMALLEDGEARFSDDPGGD